MLQVKPPSFPGPRPPLPPSHFQAPPTLPPHRGLPVTSSLPSPSSCLPTSYTLGTCISPPTLPPIILSTASHTLPLQAVGAPSLLALSAGAQVPPAHHTLSGSTPPLF